MNPSDALQIIDELAAGRNPVDGEPLPASHVCQEPDVIRSLFTAAKALKQEALRQRRLELSRSRLAPNAGAPWHLDEDNALLRGYRAGTDIPTLAKQHRRTIGAITRRLEKLGMPLRTDSRSLKSSSA